jgi:hypothetical protein
VPLPLRIRDLPSGASQREAAWRWLGLLAASLGLTIVLAWRILPSVLDLPSVRSRSPVVQSPSQPTPAERRRVRLFFPQETGTTLKELEREISSQPVLADEVRAVLRELVKGPPGARPPIPPRAEVRHVFLDAFGILYLDFNKEIQVVVTAPGVRPDLAISAIVNSLTVSFSQVKRVQFLAEGKEIAGTAGSWDLRRPLGPHFPGEENPIAVSPPPQ